jgi:uncharacterized membrane protein YqiK
MEAVGSFLQSYGWIFVVVIILALHRLILRCFGMVTIPQDSIGIVNKKFVLYGKNRELPDGTIVALNGEAGLQADTLAPGVHFGLWPWQYSITKEKFTTVPQGKMGVVTSRDGKPLTGGRVLGQVMDCNSFQDARAFLTKGGQRGPQLAIITPGTYRINTGLFALTVADVLEIPSNMVGIVTTKDGAPLPSGEIAGSEVSGHNSFQDGETFIRGGGFKGRQEQVILAGRYYINPLFATVELAPLTEVPIASVGVVISFVGEEGEDVSGDSFKHGNLVKKGQKGVWVDPLDPGKYPINPFTQRVEMVPTSNIVLNWADNAETGSHKLDENLCTITVRSGDGFTFNLDVSQIIHVSSDDAPKVIARFGTMQNLVTQVLEPTIGNYFRNAAQSNDVITFLKQRSERQVAARDAIRAALSDYNINAVDTLIGDITPPAELMKTLTDRKLAEQEQVTYGTQKLAEDTRKELEQAKAMAATQASVVSSERTVSIAEFTAQATVKRAAGEAEAKTINAKADAEVTKVTGEADASKVLAIGTAEADVVKLKIASMEAGNYAAVQIADKLSASGHALVPEIIAGGNSGNGGSTLVDILLGQLVANNQKKAA